MTLFPGVGFDNRDTAPYLLSTPGGPAKIRTRFPMASRADNMASGLSLANFSKATELKQRIWFTIGALVVFRFLSFVPLPGSTRSRSPIFTRTPRAASSTSSTPFRAAASSA